MSEANKVQREVLPVRPLVIDVSAALVSLILSIGLVLLAYNQKPIPVELGLLLSGSSAFLFGRASR